MSENNNEEIKFTDRVREDLIFLGVEGDTRDEVLKNISDELLARGIVKDTFYEALLKRENEYPTGLPIGDINVAVPHTFPENVNEIAVSVAVPKNPVVFYSMGDPDEEVVVSVICCLALKKIDENVRMLPSLMDFFANPDNLKSVLACKEPAEVMALLKANS